MLCPTFSFYSFSEIYDEELLKCQGMKTSDFYSVICKFIGCQNLLYSRQQ